MKGIDGGYKLRELLFGRGGSADVIVNVTAVEFRFWAVVLTKKLMFDKTFKKIGVAGSHFSIQLLTLNYLLYSPTDAAPQFL